MTRLRTSALMAAAAMACSLTGAAAFGGPITWVGGGADGNWSHGDNWDLGTAPDPDDELFFGGNARTTAHNDLAEGTRFGSINFNAGAGAFTLEGNGIAIGDGGFIRNQADEAQTISLDLTAEGDLTFNTATAAMQLTGDLTLAGGGSTVTIDSTEQLFLAGNLSGAADLRKIGDGAFAIAGSDNTGYTGTLTIDQGEVAIATALGGDVVLNDGTFQLFGSNIVAEGQTLTLAGGTLAMAGQGQILEDGLPGHTLASSVELTGDVTIAGGSSFRSLTLQVTGPFEVQGNHTLTIEPSTRLLLDDLGSDQAGRTLTKDGEGWLAIAGDSLDFDGTVQINAGIVEVMEQLGADITIHDEGALQGAGSVVGDIHVNDGGLLRGLEQITGNVHITSGGQHVAGQSIDGDYTLATDGELFVGYTASNGSLAPQGLDIDGSATLQQDSVVNISGSGTLAVGDSFVAISATDGIADLGATLEAEAGFLIWRAAVQGNDYILTVEQGTIFAHGAAGGNNQAIARAIDATVVAGTNSSQQALFDELNTLINNDVPAYNRALRHLSPEQVQAGPSAAVQVARNMQSAFSARMAQQRLGIVDAGATPGHRPAGPALAGGLTLASAELSPAMMAQVIGMAQQPRPEIHPSLTTRDFVHDWQVDIQAFGHYQNQDNTSDRVGYRGRTGGFLLSADRSLSPRWRVGMNVAYAHTDLSFSDGRGSGYVDHLRAGPYASYSQGPWFVDAALSAGYHHNTLARRIRVGQANLVANSTSNNFDLAAYIGGGYDIELERNVTLTPLASLDYLYYYQGSFTESDAGPANLRVDSATNDALNATLGVRLSHLIPLGDTTVIPEYALGYRYALLDEHRTTARFVGSPASFTINNDLASQHTLLLGAGASALIGEATAVYGHIQSELASDDQSHLFNVGLQFHF